MTSRHLLLLGALAAITGCDTSDPVDPCEARLDEASSSVCSTTKTARLRVVQGTTTGFVDVLLGGQVVLSTVGIGEASAFAPVTPGAYTLQVRRSGATAILGERSLTIGTQDTATLILIDSSTVINPVVLTDTGGVVPAGKTKLRVVHFATHAPEIDVWRTQPDYGTLIRVMFPFNYRDASPYLQSDPGNWTVVVTPKDQTTQLYSTGSINVPAGQARTVVLLDASGGGITSVILNY